MIDPKLFRDAEALAAARERLARRGMGAELDTLLEKLRSTDKFRRQAIGEADRAKAELNRVSKEIAAKTKRGEDVSALLHDATLASNVVPERQAHAKMMEEEFFSQLLYVPNLPAADVPAGDASHNQVVRTWGEPAPAESWRKPHWEIAKAHGLIDFERGPKLAGSGFPLYVGLGARLERSLVTYLLQLQTVEHEYTEISPPFLVTRETMTGTGQLPKFEEDLYRTEPDDLFLIPTAEVPVTNLHRGEILAGEELPRRYVAYTPCFRREAGAHGADTRGILRVHQFDKVELVWLVRPEEADAAHETLVRHAETALQRLGLAYRVVKIAAGDLGFANHRQYDLEAWAPGVGKWLEVSSCSAYADYQARRMDIRFRPRKGVKPEFVHTLNGSALGLPRTLIALLETYQQRDGGVQVPPPLVPLLGVERLGRDGA